MAAKKIIAVMGATGAQGGAHNLEFSGSLNPALQTLHRGLAQSKNHIRLEESAV